MPRALLFGGLVLAFLARPALAQHAPSCLTPDAVEEQPGSSKAWLLKARPAEVKKLLEKRVGSRKWTGNELYVPCGVGAPGVGTPGVRVEGGLDDEAVALRKRFFLDLAQKSGHSGREADALAKKYARSVDGAFFRSVRDDDGELAPEDELILRKHTQQLSAADSDAPGSEQTRSRESERQALGARIEAAQQRGDMDEMMRLAAKAQSLSAPAVTAPKKAKKTADEQAWEVATRALPELAQAAYHTRVTVDEVCGRCLLPPPAAAREK